MDRGLHRQGMNRPSNQSRSIGRMPDPSPIYVDDRETTRPNPHDRSKLSGVDILSLLRSHRTHPAAFHKHLPAGDICFTGDGPDGPCVVGIERKTIKGLLSDIRSGRFSGEQLPKLLDHYDFIFLVVEGRYRGNWATGILEEKRGRDWGPLTIGTTHFVVLELESFLNTIACFTPVKVRRTLEPHETIEYVLGLHHTFSKPWHKHSAHVAIHRPENHVMVGRASTVRRVSYALTGIGWERSLAVDKAFSSVADMCEASPKDYEALPGFGKVLSKQVWAELHGQFENGRLE